jgi:hypothetical protein
MSNDRLPTGLLVDAILAPLNARGIFDYITQRGNPTSGLILLKLNGLKGTVKLLTQQRNFMTDEIEWLPALKTESAPEPEADTFIAKARERDPDLWVIEIEDGEMVNPFDI